MKFSIKEDPKAAITWIPIFFLSTWIIMLCIGGLGHRLNISYLFKFDFWTVMVLKIAVGGLVKTTPISRWIGESK